MSRSMIAGAAALAAVPTAALPEEPLTQITRKAEMEVIEGSPETFTGRVTITGLFQRPAPSRVGGG